MMLLGLLLALPLLALAGVAILNALTFLRLRGGSAPEQPITVSILIPARDEAAVIGQTVKTVLAQRAPGVAYELLLLDDQSSDGTAEVARAAAAGDPRLRILPGAPPPPGWLGKSWACQQLADAAQSDRLLFLDADVTLAPGALAALLALAEHTRADLLTVWPTQTTQTWPERLTVPLMALAIIGYLPSVLVHRTPWPVFAAAMGQCLLFRRAAYDRIGGHAGVRAEIVEDIMFARRIKAAGLRLRAADGAGLVRCRMYTGWRSVLNGYGKNILAGHGNNPLALLVSTVFHLAIFVLSWLWLIFGAGTDGWPGWPLALIALGVGVRALTAAVTRQRIGDALLMPVSALVMTLIAGRALWQRRRRGGPQWKGRSLGAPGQAAS